MEPSIFSPSEPTNTSIYRSELPIDHGSHMDSSSSVYSSSPIDNDSPMTPLPSSSPWDGGPKPMEMDSPAMVPSPSSSPWDGGPKLMDMDTPADEPWTRDFSRLALPPLTLRIPAKNTVAPVSEINEPLPSESLPSTRNLWPTLSIFARGTAAPAAESDEPLPSTRNLWPPEGETGESSSAGTSLSMMESNPQNSFCSSAPTVPCGRQRGNSRFREDLDGTMGGLDTKPGMPSSSGNDVTMAIWGGRYRGRRGRGSAGDAKGRFNDFNIPNYQSPRSGAGTLDPPVSPRSKPSNPPARQSEADRAQGNAREARARANLRQRLLEIMDKASAKWQMLRRIGKKDKGKRPMTPKEAAAVAAAAAAKEEERR